jgi:phage shock protein A
MNLAAGNPKRTAVHNPSTIGEAAMAHIFKRVNANINDLIDRLEDPERMIKQIIREMEENIARAKEGVIGAIASEKQLLSELEGRRKQSAGWLTKAETALQQDKEDLARSALARKKESDAVIASLEPAWEATNNTSERLKTQLRQLEAKLEETKRKRTTLQARQRAAQARQQMDQTLTTFQTGLDAQTKFERMEDKVAAMEARTEAMAEVNDDASPLEKEFQQMEMDHEIEAELETLKVKVGRQQ